MWTTDLRKAAQTITALHSLANDWQYGPSHKMLKPHSARTGRSCRVQWLQLKVILRSDDNQILNINTLQTLHLAKVRDTKACQIFCPTSFFLWKNSSLLLSSKMHNQDQHMISLSLATTSATTAVKPFIFYSALENQESLTSKPFSLPLEFQAIVFLTWCCLLKEHPNCWTVSLSEVCHHLPQEE